MTLSNDQIVTVFGGTGFLGRRIVRHLRDRGCVVRIASRHADRARALLQDHDPSLQYVNADIRDQSSVSHAVSGAWAVVNAISLYAEHGRDTFHHLHVDCAGHVAREARDAGVERFIHVSGIGAEAAARSRYIRSRGEGELAVRAAFPGAMLVRPAVMFAPDDAFIDVILKLLQRMPVYPLFGSGRTRLQPVFVEDVAEAIARIATRTETEPRTFECAGPRVYTYEGFVRSIAGAAGLSPRLLSVPFAAWQVMARAAEFLPSPPINHNQVELMRIDNVASLTLPGLTDLGIVPQSAETIVGLLVSSA